MGFYVENLEVLFVEVFDEVCIYLYLIKKKKKLRLFYCCVFSIKVRNFVFGVQ